MASRSGSNRTAVDLKNGLVSRTIFVDHEIYQREGDSFEIAARKVLFDQTLLPRSLSVLF